MEITDFNISAEWKTTGFQNKSWNTVQQEGLWCPLNGNWMIWMLSLQHATLKWATCVTIYDNYDDTQYWCHIVTCLECFMCLTFYINVWHMRFSGWWIFGLWFSGSDAVYMDIKVPEEHLTSIFWKPWRPQILIIVVYMHLCIIPRSKNGTGHVCVGAEFYPQGTWSDCWLGYCFFWLGSFMIFPVCPGKTWDITLKRVFITVHEMK
jgi:hypothetical protein